MRFAEWTQRYGGVYRIRFFYAFGVIVTDPQLVRAILQVRGVGGGGGGAGVLVCECVSAESC